MSLSAIPRWMWVATGVFVLLGAAAVVAMYIMLPAGTASFLAIAGVIVCVSGAGPVLLGAYSRQRALRETSEREQQAEVIVPPTASEHQTPRS